MVPFGCSTARGSCRPRRTGYCARPPPSQLELLRLGDRSVLALSYGWLTALHPDPFGFTLQVVCAHLRAHDAALLIKRRWLAEKKTTLTALAEEYSVSAERIRQVEANAIKKLRQQIAA